MKLNEIKQALAEGRKVYHGNKNYEVIRDKIGQYLIVCSFNGYTIGLTHKDGQTMNGEESDFFMDLDMAEKHRLCAKIARKWTNEADIQTLKDHYFNEHFEWLDSMPDKELLEIANEQGIGEGQA